jgi:hypothetical protein
VIAPLALALAVAAAPPDAPLLPAGGAPGGLGGWRHALELGGHSTRFSSKEGSDYTFNSASIGYAGSVGAVGAFLHVSALVPLQASQDGAVYATANYYRRREGGDLLVGPQRRWALGSAELEAGPGFHATLIYLPARAGYRDFSAFPLGLGAGATLRWRTGAERLSRSVTLGTSASVAYDFRDPAHANDLSHGFTFRLAASIGLGGRR